jgi:hypothetical protein
VALVRTDVSEEPSTFIFLDAVNFQQNAHKNLAVPKVISVMQLKQIDVSVLNKAQAHEGIWENGGMISCILSFKTRQV